MIQYYLELQGDSERFRLQNDKKSWRRVSDSIVDKKDLLTPDVYEIIKLQEFNELIELEGKQWSLNPSGFSVIKPKNELFYHVYVIRDLFPKTPSEEQLASVIRQGDDRINNSLILNVYGFFELRDKDSIGLVCDPTIVLRNETFFAGNKYVGEAAANDGDFIHGLYVDGLIHWRDHLMSGDTDFYSDVTPTDNVDDVLKEIEDYKIFFEKNLESPEE